MKAKKRKVQRAWEPYYCKDRQSWIIPLTQGMEALIDECDVKHVQEYKWLANTVTNREKKRYTYPSSRICLDKGNMYLHRFIMNPGKGMTVDHINGNTMDNRRSNLRICTYRENSCNHEVHRSGKLVGAYKSKTGSYNAQIKVDGKVRHIGVFKTEYEAHQAYMKAYNELITKKKSAA